MRFGVCASYQQVATLATTIPIDYLEENVQRFLLPERPSAEFERQWRQARTLPIPVEAANVLLPRDLRLVATPSQAVDRARIERYIKIVLQRAEQVGIRVIVFGSGVARACPPEGDRGDAVRQVGEHLAGWGAWAQGHGVQIVLETLRYEETNVLNTVAESGDLVTRLCWHTYTRPSTGIARLPARTARICAPISPPCSTADIPAASPSSATGRTSPPR